MTWSSALSDTAFLATFVGGMIALKLAIRIMAEKESWSEFLDLALQCTVVIEGVLVGAVCSLWLIGVLSWLMSGWRSSPLVLLSCYFSPDWRSGNEARITCTGVYARTVYAATCRGDGA